MCDEDGFYYLRFTGSCHSLGDETDERPRFPLGFHAPGTPYEPVQREERTFDVWLDVGNGTRAYSASEGGSVSTTGDVVVWVT